VKEKGSLPLDFELQEIMRKTKLPKGLIKSHPQIKRPGASTYDPAIAEKILLEHSLGGTINGICRQPGYPPVGTFVQWVHDDIDGLAKRYARASDLHFDAMADELTSISDDQTLDPNSRRIMVDARKWRLSKTKRYRDNAALEVEQRTTTVQQVASVSDLRKLVRDHEAAMAAMDQDERDTGLVQ